MVEFSKPKNILELGTSVGYSTLFLAKSIQNNKGHVYTTEIMKEKIKLAKKHFKEAGLNNYISLIEKDILDVLKNWDKKKQIDFVFMDADKERYSLYLDLLLPLLNSRTLIVVDNAGKVRMADGKLIDSEYIRKFVQNVKANKKLNSIFLDMDNGLLLITKI